MWYIPFKIFFVTAQKPIFQTRDDLCDNEDIMAKPLRGHPCKSLAEFAMNATPGRRVTPPWDVYMANCHPGRQGNPTWQTRPHLSCKRDQNKIRNYIDRRVTSPTWGPQPPCKQALIRLALMHHLINGVFLWHCCLAMSQNTREMKNSAVKNEACQSAICISDLWYLRRRRRAFSWKKFLIYLGGVFENLKGGWQGWWSPSDNNVNKQISKWRRTY